MRERLETGVFSISGDWPGVFIRGDDALGFGATIDSLLARIDEQRSRTMSPDEISGWGRIRELSNLLKSCRATGRT